MSESQFETLRHDDILSEELDAQRVAMMGRSLALLACAMLVTIVSPWPAPIYIYGLLGLFALLGWAAYRTARHYPERVGYQYAFVAADFALLTFTILFPNPMSPVDLPPQFQFRFGTAMYFFLLISSLAYVYRPGLILWGGISAAASWLIGFVVVLSLPDTIWREPAVEMTPEGAAEFADVFLDVHFVSLDVRLQEVALFLICAALLSLSVKRSRALLVRQVQTARERANLSRYFPRKTADLLASNEETFDIPREHNAAVMFVDLVSFTPWSQRHGARTTIEVLRQIHALVADVVFKHDGTLDKFIGDGVMATFGTPDPDNSDPARAVGAAIDILNAFSEWRSSGSVIDTENLQLSVGLHYGPVIIGNVGNEKRLEFAVLGDTVNIASRLEHATRTVGCQGLISKSVFDAIPETERKNIQANTAVLKREPSIALRGVSRKLPVYRIG